MSEGADLRISSIDRAMANFAMTTPISFHLVLDFDAPLHLGQLESAWQRLGQRFPILRAYANFADGPTHWALDPVLPVVNEVDDEMADPGAPWAGPNELRVIRDDISLADGSPCRLTAIRRGSQHRLVWTANHALMDGSSTVFVVEGLATLYRECVVGRPTQTVADARSRCLEDVLAASGLNAVNQRLVAMRYAGRWTGPDRSDHPPASSVSTAPGYAGADVTEALRSTHHERRRRGWTTSAVLIALLARAWNRVFDVGTSTTGTSGWQVASNLRVELGVSAGIGNMSGTEPLTLHSVDRRPLADVIDEANRELRGVGSGWPGLGAALSVMQSSALPAEVLRRIATTSLGRVTALGYGRSFSNVGPWPRSIEDWAGPRLHRGFYLPAFTDPRLTTVVAYDVAGRAWISMRTHALGISVLDVANLGSTMVADAAAAGR